MYMYTTFYTKQYIYANLSMYHVYSKLSYTLTVQSSTILFIFDVVYSTYLVYYMCVCVFTRTMHLLFSSGINVTVQILHPAKKKLNQYTQVTVMFSLG